MINSKTGATLIAEMLMIRAGGWNGVFVVIEGPEDHRFWSAHLRINLEALICAEGVNNLRECMQTINDPLVDDVCAIADQDFRKYLPDDPFRDCQNVFFYDEGFLETFMLNTPALNKVLGIRCDRLAMRDYLRDVGRRTIYSHLRHMGSVFGRLRILNARNGWGLCFNKKFAVYRYVDELTWTLDQDRLMHDVAAEISCDKAFVEAECEKIGIRGAIGLLHGHDIFDLLAIGLRRRLGAAGVGARSLCTDFCLAFDTASFAHKKLARQLREWAGARPLLD